MNIVIFFFKKKKKNVKFSMENNMVPMLMTNVPEYVKKNNVQTFWDGQKLDFDFRWHDE